MSIVVFLGPTLPRREAGRILPASTLRPPARRGDVYRALADGFKTIVLIDGEFHGSPSVWQRELVDAMAEGVSVHGASSMGALRAAELHAFGMSGHGLIFEWFRDGTLVGDDEVALTYAVTSAGYQPRSEPLVNIRATLAKAVPDLLTSSERDRLVDHVKAAYFADRSFEALLSAAPVANWPSDRRAIFEHFILTNKIDQKRLDATTALTAVAAERGGGVVAKPAPSTSPFWQRERLVAEGEAWPDSSSPPEPTAASSNAAGESGARRFAASRRFFLTEWARATGSSLTGQDLAPSAAATLRESDVRRILEWASANGLEHPALDGSDLARWIVESGPARFGYWWESDVEIARSPHADPCEPALREPER